MNRPSAELDEDTLRLHVFPFLSGVDVAKCSFVSHSWCSAQLSHEVWEAVCSAAGGLEEFEDINQSHCSKNKYKAYAEAMLRWQTGRPAHTFLGGQSLLEHGIGDLDLLAEDATSMICGLCLEDFWLVLAFNGGVVQFWRLPDASFRSSFALPTNILEIDFDMKGRRLAVSLADLSVVIYDCAPALTSSGSVSLPQLRFFKSVQVTPKHIAFWGPGLALAGYREVIILDKEMQVVYSMQDAVFWDMGRSFLIVKDQNSQVDMCCWANDSLTIKMLHSEDFSEVELLCGLDNAEGLTPKLVIQRNEQILLQYLCEATSSWIQAYSTLKQSDVVTPVVASDGSVRIVQVVAGQGIMCDEKLVCEGDMLANDIDAPLAGEVCSPNLHKPTTSYVTYVDPSHRANHFSLMLLKIPGPALPVVLRHLDLGCDEELGMYQPFTASSRRFLVVSERLGIHIFDFGGS